MYGHTCPWSKNCTTKTSLYDHRDVHNVDERDRPRHLSLHTTGVHLVQVPRNLLVKTGLVIHGLDMHGPHVLKFVVHDALNSAVCGTGNPTRRRTRKAGDLGHFDLLLGDKEVDNLQHVLQLLHHLRHKDAKSRQPRSDVSKLPHSVPQNLLLRPDLVEAVRPRHAIVVEKEVLRAGLLMGEEEDPLSSCALLWVVVVESWSVPASSLRADHMLLWLLWLLWLFSSTIDKMCMATHVTLLLCKRNCEGGTHSHQ